MEPLALAVRQNIDITGIHMGGTKHKISLYADDVLFTLSDPATLINTVVDELARYVTYTSPSSCL